MIPWYRYLEVAIYSLLNLLPFLFMALYPFREQLRFSKKITGLLIVLVSMVQMAAGLLAAFTEFPASILSFISTGVYALFFLFSTRANWGNLIFTLLMLSNIANLLVCFAKYFEGLFFPELALQPYRWSFSLMLAIVEVVALIPLFFYIKTTYTAAFRKQVSALLRWFIWIIPATFYMVWTNHLYESGRSSLEVAMDLESNLFLLFITLGSLVIYHMIVLLLSKSAQNMHLTEQNYRLAMEKIQYENLNERIQEARKAKHDLRHHITTMDSFLANGEYDRLRDYLSQYKKSLPDDSTIHFCQHQGMNALLLFFAQQAKDHQIDFDVSVECPQDLAFPEHELAVLMGNLLENALEACQDVFDRPRFLRIRSRIQRDALYIQVDNTYRGELKMKNGHYLSTKHPGRGIGLGSVEEIVERFQGLIEIQPENGVFQVSILLPLTK